ncbi:MAG TPA: nucleotidyltransferase domain-containing protein [Magnetococcales bacterium]|nr:nucleotidyltransferase domain-containing protein [Magnetococcales bacterium]
MKHQEIKTKPDTVVRSLLEGLRQRFRDLLAIYAFGSRVSGNAGPESDLDLAILVEGKADSVALWHLAGELGDLTGCPVDLLDLRAASTVMQHRIITTGERLWARDHQADLYESFILSEKTALDEARAPLMAIIQREGTIHGR